MPSPPLYLHPSTPRLLCVLGPPRFGVDALLRAFTHTLQSEGFTVYDLQEMDHHMLYTTDAPLSDSSRQNARLVLLRTGARMAQQSKRPAVTILGQGNALTATAELLVDTLSVAAIQALPDAFFEPFRTTPSTFVCPRADRYRDAIDAWEARVGQSVVRLEGNTAEEAHQRVREVWLAERLERALASTEPARTRPRL